MCFYPSRGLDASMPNSAFSATTLGIRFSGIIHERIHDCVDEVCRSDHLTVGRCASAIRHLGYEVGVHRKIPRNLPLLRDYLKRDPSRVYLLVASRADASTRWR